MKTLRLKNEEVSEDFEEAISFALADVAVEVGTSLEYMQDIQKSLNTAKRVLKRSKRNDEFFIDLSDSLAEVADYYKAMADRKEDVNKSVRKALSIMKKSDKKRGRSSDQTRVYDWD
jgi:ubiquinone/menaquinone biosynthesis C-methylase UbiE